MPPDQDVAVTPEDLAEALGELEKDWQEYKQLRLDFEDKWFQKAKEIRRAKNRGERNGR